MTAQRKPSKAIPTPASTPTARKGVVAFFTDIWAEFKKVVWPTRQETMRLTIIVIIITTGLGLILGGVDLAFAKLIGVIGGSR